MPVLFAGAGSCVPVSGTSPSGAYGRLLVWWTKRLSCLARFPHTSVNLGSVHVCNAETALKFAFLIITIIIRHHHHASISGTPVASANPETGSPLRNLDLFYIMMLEARERCLPQS